MKTSSLFLLASLTAVLFVPVVVAAEATTPPVSAPVQEAPLLTAGSTVTVDALKSAKWLQGAAPAEWKAGELYVFECWATWCGPCIQAIPHMDALHRKYGEKGLHVYGMNVLDKDEETAAKFVKKKGEGMSYPVAYVEKGEGAFEKEWMVPARVLGIPHTFIVADGKVLAMSHPMALTDEVVADLLAGGERRAAAVAQLSPAAKETQDRNGLQMALSKAVKEKDIPTAEARLADYENADKSGGRDATPQLMRLEIALLKNDEAAFNQAVEGITIPWAIPAILTGHEAQGEEFSVERMKTLAARIEAITPGQKDLQAQLALASLDWKLGKKDEAKALIQQGIDMPESVVGEPLKRLKAKMEEGTFPKMADVLQDIKSSYPGGGH